jgi:hypothetical protein
MEQKIHTPNGVCIFGETADAMSELWSINSISSVADMTWTLFFFNRPMESETGSKKEKGEVA